MIFDVASMQTKIKPALQGDKKMCKETKYMENLVLNGWMEFKFHRVAFSLILSMYVTLWEVLCRNTQSLLYSS